LLIFYVTTLVLFGLGVYFLVKFYGDLRDPKGRLKNEWALSNPMFYVFLKYTVPVVIIGFIANICVSLLHLIKAVMQS